MLALPPDVVRWVSRSGEDPDCAIVAISLACGATYDAVLAEAIQVTPDAVSRGMNWRQIRATVKRLGFTSTLKRKYDLEDDTGILDCKRGREEHVVYLWEGRIIEPRLDRRALWKDPDAFLAHEGWTPGMLLTVKKD
jgi:hypothetical protein